MDWSGIRVEEKVLLYFIFYILYFIFYRVLRAPGTFVPNIGIEIEI